MSSTNGLTKEVQEQILQTIGKSQDAVVDGIRAWSQAIEKIALPLPSNPLADQLPKPADAVDAAFDLAEQLLAAQREFAHNLLGAAEPVVERTKQQTAKATRKSQEA
jgi:hypothetical protein